MQGWMNANVAAPFNSRRGARLAPALEALARGGPGRYERWAQFASRGAEAALRADWEEVRTTCEACHQEYRDDYRRTYRHLPLPETLKGPL